MLNLVKVKIGGKTYDRNAIEKAEFFTDKGYSFEMLISYLIELVEECEEADGERDECEECGALVDLTQTSIHPGESILCDECMERQIREWRRQAQ